MSTHDSSRIDQLLDLLLDALQERQAARAAPPPAAESSAIDRPVAEEESAADDTPVLPPVDEDPLVPAPQPMREPEPHAAAATTRLAAYIPEKLPTIHLDRLLGRLAAFLLGLIIVINVPFNRFGTNLARAMPDEQSLVIRDGLVLKGEGDKIYVLEDNQKRWISSLDAFNYYGYRWDQVNLVDDRFLEQFPDGPALSILYQCTGSPHVFAFENGVRRWIRDIPTFEAQGFVWEDVQPISCARLERIPVGPPIPPDAGEPPPP